MTTNPVVQAILSMVSDPHVREAELIGTYLESGANATAVGDNGNSWGPFQINGPSHPGITAAQAEDPSWAVQYMTPEYEAAVAQVPASLWSSNPEQAAERAADLAERPQNDYYVARGAATVDQAWANAVAALNGQDVGPLSGYAPLGGSATGTATGQDASLPGWIRSLFPGGGLDTPGKILQGSGIDPGSIVSSAVTSIEKYGLMALFVAAGVGLVVVGLARATGAHPSPDLAAAAVAL